MAPLRFDRVEKFSVSGMAVAFAANMEISGDDNGGGCSRSKIKPSLSVFARCSSISYSFYYLMFGDDRKKKNGKETVRV